MTGVQTCALPIYRIEKTDLCIQDGKIYFKSKNQSPDRIINAEGKYVFPGFFDIHFHGCNLFDFTLGKYSPETRSFDDSEEAFSKGISMLAMEKARQGVTSAFPSAFAAPIENLQACLKYLKKFMESKANGLQGAFLHGAFLEGTFISPDFLGAQSPGYVFKPDIKIIAVTDSMFVAGSNKVREFEIGGVKGMLNDNASYIAVKGKANTLFGSVITTDKAFSNLLSWLTRKMEGIWIRRHPALDLEKALVSMAKIFSTNSCNMLGLDSRGVIEKNKQADLTIGSISGEQGDYNFKAEHTLVKGRIVFSTD